MVGTSTPQNNLVVGSYLELTHSISNCNHEDRRLMFWEDIRNVKNVKVKIHLLFKRPHTPSQLVKARLDAHLFELGPYHYYPR